MVKLIEAFKLTRHGDFVSYGHVRDRLGDYGPTLDADVQELVGQGLVEMNRFGEERSFFLTKEGWDEVTKIQNERPMQRVIDALVGKHDLLRSDLARAGDELHQCGERAVGLKASLRRIKSEMRELREAIALLEGGNA